MDGLVWVLDAPGGPEAVRLAQLKARYYDPGLLAKHLGFNDEPLRDVAAFRGRGVDLYPDVAITAADAARVAFRVEDQGGGIGRVQVLLNGAEVVADARSAGGTASGLDVEVDLTPFRAFLVPAAENVVEVVVENASGSLRSRRHRTTFRASAARGPDTEAVGDADDGYLPHLWAVVVGTGDYVGGALDLAFAGKDAADLASALDIAAGRLFGPERTRVTLLSTEAEGAGRPTRSAITDALSAVAAQADARDVLLVYLAGHGVVHGGADGDFYYLTADAATGDLADEAVRATVALSAVQVALHARPQLVHLGKVTQQEVDADACRARQRLVARRRRGTVALRR